MSRLSERANAQPKRRDRTVNKRIPMLKPTDISQSSIELFQLVQSLAISIDIEILPQKIIHHRSVIYIVSKLINIFEDFLYLNMYFIVDTCLGNFLC